MEQRHDDRLEIAQESEPKGVRKLIAGRLSAVWREAVHVTLHKDIRVSAFYENKGSLPYSLIDYVLYGVVQMLRREEFRTFNSHYDGGMLRTFHSVNLGLAIDHPKGLIVPVLHRAERDDLDRFVMRRKELTARAKSWKHLPHELENGTFTVTNLGTMGVDFFTPILNPPQAAILGLGRVRFQAVAREWGVPPVPEALLPLSLTVDHRVIDGAGAAQWLAQLEETVNELVAGR